MYSFRPFSDLLLLLFCILIIASCGEDMDDTTIIPPPADTLAHKVEYVLNGAEFFNQFVQYSDFIDDQSGVWYDADRDSTTIKAIAYWNGQIANLFIVFPGKEESNFVFEDPEFLFDGDKGFGILFETSRQLFVDNDDFVSFTIEEYGEVGELVKGTFLGGFEEVASNAHIQINNGLFEIIRKE